MTGPRDWRKGDPTPKEWARSITAGWDDVWPRPALKPVLVHAGPTEPPWREVWLP
ncbi:hypothetical protein HS041_12470 [Planomonospora sp. ID67723]|uniref:hypothetical protein n=1 Tax=Planomonospora sp. ID67723 TaxID=2738134 RepID=UPI0018C3DEE0|nr:hypothetical protein [Planomonospora sp. ID67723]MBG0828584.1 hypothetical protein [Planomonospora sp. ID67723]